MNADCALDWYTLSKIRSLDKKRRRMRRIKREEKFVTKSFDQQMNELQLKRDQEAKQAKIKQLLETIKAMQIIGEPCTALREAEIAKLREELDKLLRPRNDGTNYNQQ